MDKLTPAQRSYNMAQIKSKNTKPETIIFKILKANGVKFRKHYSIHGKPDIAFPEMKIAVFIDGEFWHGKDFKEWKAKLTPFWLNKIEGNIKRDRYNARLLKKQGWRFLRIWGREITKEADKSSLRIIKFIERHS